MNAKFLKKIRKHIREMFPEFPSREAYTSPGTAVWVPDYERGLRPDGTPYLKPFHPTGTTRNVANTVRGVYRAVKKNRRVA